MSCCNPDRRPGCTLKAPAVAEAFQSQKHNMASATGPSPIITSTSRGVGDRDERKYCAGEEHKDHGDETDEEAELRACALEAQLAFQREETPPPPGSPVDSEVIVIDSDTEGGPPAQSRADKLRGAMTQLSNALGNRIQEADLREALEETVQEGKSQT